MLIDESEKFEICSVFFLIFFFCFLLNDSFFSGFLLNDIFFFGKFKPSVTVLQHTGGKRSFAFFEAKLSKFESYGIALNNFGF